MAGLLFLHRIPLCRRPQQLLALIEIQLIQSFMRSTCLRFLLLFVTGIACASPPLLPQPQFAMFSEQVQDAPVVSYDLVQDQTGYLWLASELDGLQRFDGYELLRYPIFFEQETAQRRANVNRILSAKRQLWVSTWGQGFSLLDHNGALLRRYHSSSTPALPSDHGQTMYQDAQGRTWLATVAGLRVVEPGLNLAAADKVPAELRDNRVWQIQQDTLGALWFATSTGLYRFSQDLTDKQHWPVPSPHARQHSQEIRTLLLTEAGVWFGTQLGLYWLAFAEPRQVVQAAPAIQRVNALFQDSTGLWIGTSRGLYLLSQQQQLQHFLGSADIRQLYLDKTQVLWISSRNLGLFKRDPIERLFEPWYFPGVSANDELPVHQLQSMTWLNDHIWLGLDRQLLAFSPTQQSYTAVPFDTQNRPTRVSAVSRSGQQLWIATDAGLFRQQSDQVARQVTLPTGLPPQPEITSLFAATDNSLWFGVWEQGLYHWQLNSDTKTLQHYAVATQPGDAIIQLKPDRNHLWLVSRFSGLYRLTPETGQLTHFHQGADSPLPLPSDTLLCAEAASRGGWWLCTDQGLFWFNPATGEHQLYSKQQGLPDQRVIAVSDSGDGRIWISTRRGLAMLDSNNQRIYSFGRKDGLPAMSLGVRALAQHDKDQLFIGTHQGLFRIEPDKLKDEELQTSMVISKLELDQKSIPVPATSAEQPLVLPLHTKRLQIHFSFLEFYYTDLHHYQYRLLGLSEQWHPLGTIHQVSFNHLPTGTYVFEVRNSTFQDETNAARLHFVVPAPWWQDYKLWLGFALIAAFVSWRLWCWRNRLLLKQYQKLNLMVSERTQALAAANHALNQQARTDFLTQLPNRLAFTEQFERSLAQAQRSGQPMALVLLDVDHFKQINDQYGHETGDYVLVQIGQLLVQRLRKQDLVARWGGEEFILLLPDTTVEGALQLCEELRHTISQMELCYQQKSFHISATFGVQVRRASHSDALDQWCSSADQALYSGKRSGRNRVVLYAPAEPVEMDSI